MSLTTREQAIVEHLSLIAKGWLAAAIANDNREDREVLADMYRAKASGLIVGISYIRGITPLEVEAEFEEELDDDEDLNELPAGSSA